MTDENKMILDRINQYAEQVLADIEDPQKVQVSIQLDRLRPIMEIIAEEKGMKLEDVFILYMDLQSEASARSEAKLRESLSDLGEGNGTAVFS